MTGVTVVTGAVEGFDYGALDMETRVVVQQRTGEIRSLVRRSAQDIIDIGLKLGEVKQRLGHGGFGKWLEAEFEWSERTARQFMQVGERFKSANFADLNVAPSALYLLAASSTPDEAVEEALERAAGGERITHAAAKGIVEAHRPAAPQPNGQVVYPAETPAIELMPIEEWELAEFVERIAGVVYGESRLQDGVVLRSMAADTQSHGAYWSRLMRALAPFDVSERQVAGAVIDFVGKQRQQERLYWRPAAAPIPSGWDEADEAEYQALLPVWQQPASQMNLLRELDRITRRRVAERLSVERLDNIRFSLQERTRVLWLAERRQEKERTASQPIEVDGDRPLPGWVTEDAPAASDKSLLSDDEASGDDVDVLPDVDVAYTGQPVAEEGTPVSLRDGYDSDEWYTPGWVIEAARQVMSEIDLDPASCELAQEVVQAGLFWSKQQGGERMGWFGRVWLNPPYSEPKAFVDKLLAEYAHGNVKQAVVLLNNATETGWFQALLARFPVCFLSKRLAFWRHDHADVGARQGQAVFYLGPDVEKFCEVFGEFGIVVKRLD